MLSINLSNSRMAHAWIIDNMSILSNKLIGPYVLITFTYLTPSKESCFIPETWRRFIQPPEKFISWLFSDNKDQDSNVTILEGGEGSPRQMG